MFQNDYIMRQIEMFTVFLARILFNKETTVFDAIVDEAGNVTEAGELYLGIRELVKAGKINEAENLLFERIELTYDKQYLEVASDFYSHLNFFTDEYLEAHDFSREEVQEGLQRVREIYNVETILPPGEIDISEEF